MKRLYFAFLLLVSLCSYAQKELNVLTFNIRYDNRGDSLNAWPYRKDYAAGQVLFHQVHLLGVQEALHHQLSDLQERLPDYRWFGAGRDDGKTKGEYSAIFYDSKRLQLLTNATFWLAENPSDTGKKGWDAAFPRVVTWGKFRDRKSKKTFYMFNTHFDHMGKVARRESARLLVQKVAEIAGGSPVIITGDFNADPASEPVRELLNAPAGKAFIDSKAVSLQPHYGPTGTFNGFQAKETSDQPIDYIFIKNRVSVLQHATLSQSWMGRFSSDHFPVLARIEF